MKICKWLLLQLAVLSLSQTLMAATHYVWCGATGAATGADFNNAYTILPSSLTRGDTYVIAGSGSCNYGTSSYQFQDAESGTTVITIRHASSNLDSSVAGFQSSFATAQARWLPTGTNAAWVFRTGYYTLDGNPDIQAGGGLGGKTCTGLCGFLLQDNVDIKNTVGFIYFAPGSGGDASHVTLKGFEIDNSGTTAGSSSGQSGIALFASQGAWDFMDLERCYIHDIPGGPITLSHRSNTWIMNRCAIVRYNPHPSPDHAEAIGFTEQTNITLSYNLIQDCQSTACISLQNTTGTSSGLIYGNVFYLSNPTLYYTDTGVIVCINGQVCKITSANNTFLNFPGSAGGSAGYNFSEGSSGTSLTVYNDLWYNSTVVGIGVCSGCNLTHDYNCFMSSSGFPSESHPCTGSTNFLVSAGTSNFHLLSETPGSGFNTHSILPVNDFDADGNARATADSGTWSRGAYQFGTATSGTAPMPPSALAAVVN